MADRLDEYRRKRDAARTPEPIPDGPLPTGGDDTFVIQQHHARITNLHVKDMKRNAGPYTAFGEGDAPIKDVLQLLSKNKWDIPASIELEYNVPEGSDAVKEVKKCVEYCRAALTART